MVLYRRTDSPFWWLSTTALVQRAAQNLCDHAGGDLILANAGDPRGDGQLLEMVRDTEHMVAVAVCQPWAL